MGENKKSVYLTIDDAPSIKMDKLLDYLIKNKHKAIFFCQGNFMEKRPEPVIRAIKKGFIIGNHSYSHQDFNKISYKKGKEEIIKTDNILKRLYKKAGISWKHKYFRFPKLHRGGKNMLRYQKLLYNLGYFPSLYGDKYFLDWNCTLDTKDYKGISKKGVINTLKKIKSNEIILIHDKAYTINNLFIPACEFIKKKGFKLDVENNDYNRKFALRLLKDTLSSEYLNEGYKYRKTKKSEAFKNYIKSLYHGFDLIKIKAIIKLLIPGYYK